MQYNIRTRYDSRFQWPILFSSIHVFNVSRLSGAAEIESLTELAIHVTQKAGFELKAHGINSDRLRK